MQWATIMIDRFMTDRSADGVFLLTQRHVAPALDPETYAQYEPPTRWEGHVKGATGSARQADFGLVVTLGFAAGLIVGDGRSPDFPRDGGDAARAVHISGTRTGDHVSFDLCFFADTYFKSRPFHFSGRLDSEERKIAGEWTFQCEPSCSCSGSTGSFTLNRVD